MSKHTPGPWVVVDTGSVFGSLAIKPIQPELASPAAPHGWSICQIHGPEKKQIQISAVTGKTKFEFDEYGQKVFERNLANATLMATSPDLLDFIRRLATEEFRKIAPSWHADAVKLIAQATITAKATGGEG